MLLLTNLSLANIKHRNINIKMYAFDMIFIIQLIITFVVTSKAFYQNLNFV